MPISQVPPTTVQRLPLYLRVLVDAQSQRIDVINSSQIAELTGSNAAQVRKDLSYLGEFGVRGQGYDVNELVSHLARHLGLERTRRACIVGFGRMGSALANYAGFQDRGVSIVAVFDNDPEKIGLETGTGLVVRPLSDLDKRCTHECIEIALLAVPVAVAQRVAERVVAAGIKAILNFAPVKLDLPDNVALRQADVAAELQILSYHLGVAEAAK